MLPTGFIDLLNEFEMVWALRDRFPLHIILFKQTACHLAHEGGEAEVADQARAVRAVRGSDAGEAGVHRMREYHERA